MNRLLLTLVILLLAAVGVEAKYWKIGPSSVTGMDFASINAAMSSSNVTKGDTLYLDQYYNEAAVQTVTKQVVIIGTGYDTSLTDEQVVAQLTNNLVLKSNNVVVKSVKLSGVYFYNDNCTVERCYGTFFKTFSTTAGMNRIYSSYIEGSIEGYGSGTSNYSKYDIRNNCIIRSNYCLKYITSSIVDHNVIISKDYTITYTDNSQLTNNIIISSSYPDEDLFYGVADSGSGNSIEHNILSRTSSLSYYPTNKIGFGSKISELFTQTGSFSDKYKLVDNSAAKGYATDGGEVGCHGGMFGCPSGGRPQYIPYFTKVTVGSRSENGKLPVSVTIKIQEE